MSSTASKAGSNVSCTIGAAAAADTTTTTTTTMMHHPSAPHLSITVAHSSKALVGESENVRKLKWDIPQVLRYSALGAGIFYGFTHQRSISAAEKAAAAQREYEHKQELINKAKEAYAKSKQPVSATSTPSGRASLCLKETVNQDPMSPNFDIEAYFSALLAKA
ncbi:ATP synthase E chain-domain-containing protein [Neurospora tetraspora]|uniref:ATP synthase F(0) complex subunit e, mitochondrial n=1 Tax=Neurospora tetraspora TaxID=94610 RepID=A0AAE0JPP7_9PEZI|nr:ATP synthase E chain-domain-containing protein [Neurospora tetraspora]